MTTTNKPIDHIRLGTIQAAIWKNATDDDRPYYSISFEKRYTDRDGNWQSATSFLRDELLVLAKAAEMAFARVHELQSEERARAAAATNGKKAKSR